MTKARLSTLVLLLVAWSLFCWLLGRNSTSTEANWRALNFVIVAAAAYPVAFFKPAQRARARL